MEIHKIRWKSSDGKKPAWNRAKVSIRAAGPILSMLSIHTPKYMKIYKIYENPWKSMEIHGNPWKSIENMKIYEIRWKSSDDKKPAWNRATVSIGAASWFLSPLDTHTPKYMKIYQDL